MENYDVVVVGLGFAGAMSALSAAALGARVAVFEKSAWPGGNSILSSGSAVSGREYGLTHRYLEELCAGKTPADVLDAFAQGMVDVPDLMRDLARDEGLSVVEEPCSPYPLPGCEQIFMVHVRRRSEDDSRLFPWCTGVTAGATLFHLLYERIQRNPRIDVFLGAPVRRLLQNDDEVTGVRAGAFGDGEDVMASRAVILCSGGFEHNGDMLEAFVESEHLISAAHLGNTGDGVELAQRAGARLWHMWHLHGSYGFRLPGVPMAIRHRFGGWRDPDRPMPWIALDRDGRRFMNEYPYATSDTAIRRLLQYDTERQCYPRIPSVLVFDEEGRKLGPIGAPRFNEPGLRYAWSEDNLREVEAGYIQTADTLSELAERLGLPGEQIADSVRQWNDAVARGEDAEFSRRPGTMMQIARAPFYGIQCWPTVSNTQGGPAHDAQQRVIAADREPIRRLYAAGELGSIWGQLYLLGGNITECLIGGKIAGQCAAQESPL